MEKIEETPEGPVFRTQADVRSTDEETFPTDYFTNKAIEFINQQKEHLFCCMLCFPDPHSANLVRPPYDTMYNQIKFKEPVTVLADTTGRPAWSHGNNLPADQPEDMAQYFGMIKCIDDNVGRIMKTLQDADILSNTIIIFTSDHGDMCRQHGLINKGVPLDDSARIPFIISYPTGMRQGIRVENVMSVTDFTPSLLSFCNISSETPYDGRDLSVLWKGNKLPAQYKDIVFMRAVTHKIESDWDESATAKRTMWISAVTPDYKLTYSEYASDIPWLTDLKKIRMSWSIAISIRLIRKLFPD